MKKYKWIIILINLLIFLALFNNSIFKKEALLTKGKLILLELAPVDPRSLMQGDYMTLNYAISQNINHDSISKRGFCVVKIEKDGIAKKVRLQEGRSPINKNEHLIEYTSLNWGGINIGARSEEHTSELQSRPHLVCRLLLEKKKKIAQKMHRRRNK